LHTVASAKQVQLKEDVFLMVKYYNKLFKGSVGDVYQIVLSPRPANKLIINGFESSLNSGTNLQYHREKYCFNYFSLAHYKFHRWNGWLYGWNQNHEEVGRLLDEGNNVYYETKSFLKLLDRLKLNNYIPHMDTEAYNRINVLCQDLLDTNINK